MKWCSLVVARSNILAFLNESLLFLVSLFRYCNETGYFLEKSFPLAHGSEVHTAWCWLLPGSVDVLVEGDITILGTSARGGNHVWQGRKRPVIPPLSTEDQLPSFPAPRKLHASGRNTVLTGVWFPHPIKITVVVRSPNPDVSRGFIFGKYYWIWGNPT